MLLLCYYALLLSALNQTIAMKKMMMFLALAGFSGIGLSSCSSEPAEDELMVLNATGTEQVSSADISSGDLTGTWRIYSMSADVAVDFDKDGAGSQDILSETGCFSNMYFTFNQDGSVQTTQARLYFDTSGNFTCNEKNYSATYEVTNNQLKVFFSVDGVSYSEVKDISLSGNGIDEFLHVSLTKAETSAAVYVAPDPGNTVASEIQKIDFVYIKD